MEKNKEQKNAYDFLTEIRGVNYLVHFTPIDNLDSILKKGLVPRSELSEESVLVDKDRFEEMLDCSCLSISFPNNLMLYSKHREYIFAILKISPKILRDKNEEDVYFMFKNAASKQFKGKFESFKGLPAAQKLFYDFETVDGNRIWNFRTRYDLPDNFPTHPQAEVLIRGVIEPKYIEGIKFKSDYELTKAKQVVNVKYHCLFETEPELFGKRCDTSFWQKG